MFRRGNLNLNERALAMTINNKKRLPDLSDSLFYVRYCKIIMLLQR